jgi:hypothetical protein
MTTHTLDNIPHRAAAGWCIPHEAQIKAALSAAIIPLSAADIATYKAESCHAEETFFAHFLKNFSAMEGERPRETQAAPQLPATWLAPVAAFWASLISRLEDPGLNDQTAAETARQAIDRMPELIAEMDVEALTDQFEASMGQAAIISMRDRLRRRAYPTAALHALSATGPTIQGVEYAPMLQAVAKLKNKTAITAALDSEQWRRVPLELRDRAFFSARVESVRFLSIAQRKLQHRLELTTEQLENGKAALVNRDSFIRDMRRIAEEEGLQTTGPAGRGTVRDIRSVKRLGLIYDIQTESAAGYARWKVDTDPDVLDEFPAYRLGPSTARQPRPESYWRNRWQQAGDATGWQGATRTSMVALKTSPIWQALSIFGTPWPPFDYGSSRLLEDVDRDEAAALGLVPRTGPVPAFGAKGSTPEAFNETLQASTRGLMPSALDNLELAFGDQIEVAGTSAKWRNRNDPYKTFADYQLPSASIWKALERAPDRISAAEATRQMNDGLKVEARARTVVFDKSTLDHWNGYHDEYDRPAFLPHAVATVQRPTEVWKQETQELYVKGFEKPDGKLRGCVVAVKQDGTVKTYFVENLKRLDNARKGIGFRNE